MTVTPQQLFDTMVARQRAAREEQAKNAAALKQRVREAVAAVVHEGLVRRAWLLGSLAP